MQKREGKRADPAPTGSLGRGRMGAQAIEVDFHAGKEHQKDNAEVREHTEKQVVSGHH